MALKLSTKMRNQMLNGEDLRRIFEDAVIKIWSGSAPATADLAPTGTLLATISKASGTVSAGEVSTPQETKILIGSFGAAETFTFIDDSVSYTYTNTPTLGSAILVAAAFAAVLDAQDPNISAFASGTATIYIQAKYKGVAHTWSSSGSGMQNGSTGAHACADTVSNVLADTIRWGVATDGIISKESATWSGLAVANGTAGYFRMETSADTDVDDTSNKIFARMQGSVGVSGTEMILSNTTITSGATQTIDTATITLPAS